MSPERLTARHVWGMPVAIGVLSAIGLVSALLGDGMWDALSWAALATPVAVVFWYVGLSVVRRSYLVSRG